jgi:hypothetical protein
MLSCVKCGKALAFPQFECSKCKGDFCRDCAAEAQKCKACATVLSRFRMPEAGATRDFVPGSGS